jgi:hypothetical protein
VTTTYPPAAKVAPPGGPSLLPSLLRPIIECAAPDSDFIADIPESLRTALRDIGALLTADGADRLWAETPDRRNTQRTAVRSRAGGFTIHPHLVCAGATAVALGVARSTVDAAATMVTEMAAKTGSYLADEAHTRYAIAKADNVIEASRRLLLDRIETLQRLAECRGEVTVLQHVNLSRRLMEAAGRVRLGRDPGVSLL